MAPSCYYAKSFKLARPTRQAPQNVALSESRSTQRKVFRIKGSPPNSHQLPGR
jgi:hypothetical protein